MKKKETFSPLFSSAKSGSLSFSVRASKATTTQNVSGVVFEPFEEVKKELDLLPNSPQISLARHMYSPECEAAVNEQINVEYNASYVYHALYAYFDRDNVALKGLAKFFKDSSVEEREHAEKLMEYQNKRGGRVKLQPMVMPLTEFDHSEKGDALYAMELTLSLEKLVNEKLLKVHSVASKNDDVQLADFIESEFLNEQVEAIKKISEYVSEYLDYVQAVAGFMTEVTKNSVSFDPSQLALTSDAASAIEIISFCLADSGNAFLVPTPYSPGVVER